MASFLSQTRIQGTGAVGLPNGTTAQRTGVTSTVQSFTATGPGTFTVPSGIKVVDVLIIGGGGSGANSLGGGGGAGGFVEARNLPVDPGSSIPVVVGSGGSPNGPYPQYIPGNPGQNSSFGTIVAYGGGAGAGYSNGPAGSGTPGQIATYVNHGFRGGSGGGGGGTESQWSGKGEGIQGLGLTMPTGAIGWGFPGGSGSGPGPRSYGGGGGGGAGGEGSPNPGNGGGAGGPGRASDITGSRVYYAGGGGGGAYAPPGGTPGPGGLGGGGAGGVGGSGVSGTANTGGGGGCGGYFNINPGSGGPGVVIVRYSRQTSDSTTFEGALRYNTNLNRTEIYNGTIWEPMRPKTVQSFTATGPGTFTVPTGVSEIEVLVVAGGGGAGNIGGGGGGGGVVHHARYPVTPGGSVPYSVGGGGSSGPAYSGPPASNGTPSVFGVLEAYGGGGSGAWATDPPGGTVGSGAGGPGHPGIGRNGGVAEQPRATNGNIGASNFGFPGCRGGTNGPQGSDYSQTTGSGQYTGGGGGGAGKSGGDNAYILNIDSQSVTQIGRNFITEVDAGRQGGDGKAFDISGTWQYYGGGGAGGGHNPGYNNPGFTARGGLGGGGNGSAIDISWGPSGRGQPGTTNTGGGGGGGWYTGGGTAQGGDGGPGIIIVRY